LRVDKIELLSVRESSQVAPCLDVVEDFLLSAEGEHFHVDTVHSEMLDLADDEWHRGRPIRSWVFARDHQDPQLRIPTGERA
jgi:hypothetical protein